MDRGRALDSFANYFGIDVSRYRIEHMPDAIILWDRENGAFGYSISVEQD